MPVIVRRQRLHEAFALVRCLRETASDQAGSSQHPIDARRAHGHNVGIQHHERQPPVTLQRIPGEEGEDRLFSHSSNQWSRGTSPLCSLALP